MTQRTFLRPRRLASITIAIGMSVAVAVLSGCSASPATSASTASGATALRFQASWVNDAEFMGYFLAVDKGYYSDAGLDVIYTSGGPAVIPESTLLAGTADIALTSPDTTISAITGQDAPFVIIGAQYQQNPLGVVSLTKNGITGPNDLVGKTVAVPDVSRLAFDAMLTINNIDPKTVTVVPYAYDPTPLIAGEVDATVDFVTNVPFSIEQLGEKASSFTLYDAGFKIPTDTVVVTKDFLASNKPALKAWLQASVKGWTENFVDTAAYPKTLENTWFKGTGRTVANEEWFNAAQKPLIESSSGMFKMTPESIADTIASLAAVNIVATPDMFDMSLFD
jgi:ABC-type nitrate/sulfonate/bicarbonate transport system substrate-binding protein